MADISQITLPSGVYNLKDAAAREALSAGIQYVMAWSGVKEVSSATAADLAKIPQGVVIDDGDSSATGTLAPSVSTVGIIYLVRTYGNESGNNQSFDEYLTIYVDTDGYHWEKLGSTDIKIGTLSAWTNEAQTTPLGESFADNIVLHKISKTGTYSDLIGKPTLGTASAKDVASSGNASTSQVVMGNDTRLSDSRPASDVSDWAKAATKPSYSYGEITGTPTLGTAAAKDVPASGNASTTQVVLGNDSRLSDSRPASDVSAWAKASTKPSYSLSELSDDATHRVVTDTDKSTWNGKYTKPSGGIPTSDLASAARTAIEKASSLPLKKGAADGSVTIIPSGSGTIVAGGENSVNLSDGDNNFPASPMDFVNITSWSNGIAQCNKEHNLQTGDYIRISSDLTPYRVTRKTDTTFTLSPTTGIGQKGTVVKYAAGAFGEGSLAAGSNSIAGGEHSFAAGYQSRAMGDESVAMGFYAQAKNNYEFSVGRYNYSNYRTGTFGYEYNTLFSVGNGNGNSYSERKNAFEIMQNADAYLYGICGYKGTDPYAAGAMSLQQLILYLQLIPLKVNVCKLYERAATGGVSHPVFQFTHPFLGYIFQNGGQITLMRTSRRSKKHGQIRLRQAKKGWGVACYNDGMSCFFKVCKAGTGIVSDYTDTDNLFPIQSKIGDYVPSNNCTMLNIAVNELSDFFWEAVASGANAENLASHRYGFALRLFNPFYPSQYKSLVGNGRHGKDVECFWSPITPIDVVWDTNEENFFFGSH